MKKKAPAVARDQEIKNGLQAIQLIRSCCILQLQKQFKSACVLK